MILKRVRVPTMLLAVLAAGLFLGGWVGLQRRRERFRGLTSAYSQAALRVMTRLTDLKISPDDVGLTVARAHWNFAVASRYWQSSGRPWWPGEPEPMDVRCGCSVCRGVFPCYVPTALDLQAPGVGPTPGTGP